MKIILYICLTIVSIAVLLGLVVGLGLFGLEYKKFFAPKHEEIRREVFVQTRSYNQGKIMELEKHRIEYLREKDTTSKTAIGNMILHKFADFDREMLSPEQRQFLKQVESNSINY